MEKTVPWVTRCIHWLQNPKYRTLTCIAAIIAVFYGVLAYALLHEGDALHTVIFVGFSYYMLRILYEYTLNRAEVPTLSTGFLARRKIAHVLKKEFSSRVKGARIYDMGSGDGALVRAIANVLPQADIIGIEHFKLPHAQAQFFKKLFNIKNAEYRRASFWDTDCRDADAVVMFLSSNVTLKLGEKLQAELRPGALVISNEFPLGGVWQPFEILRFYAPYPTTFYMYRKG